MAFRNSSSVLEADLRDQMPELTEVNSKDALEKANVALSRSLTLKSSKILLMNYLMRLSGSFWDPDLLSIFLGYIL